MAAQSISSSDLVNGEFLTPGEKFGDYQVMQCYSFDLFGGVYRIQHIVEFDESCVFVFPKALSEADGFAERVGNQVNTLAELEHPNIVNIENTFEINGRVCLRLESIEGINLLDYVEKYTREQQQASGAAQTDVAVGRGNELFLDFPFGLPAAETKHFLKQCVEALKAAQGAHVNHLLLNPNFIIVTPEGETKITGFGLYHMIGQELLAQFAKSGPPTVALGPRRVKVNSFDLIDPLVLRPGADDLDEDAFHRSDYFSLGRNGFYILTGHKAVDMPSDDDDSGEGNFRAASSYSGAIQPGWDRFFGKCLDPDPQKRYANFRALSSDLDRADRVVEVKKEDDASIAKTIERIPIPKKIAAKLGPETLKFVRLGLFGMFAMVVVGIASLCYSIIFAEEAMSGGPIARRAKEGQKPSLSMTIVPSSAKVLFSRNGEASFITTDGTLNVVMSRGDYEVTISASDHVTKTETLPVGRESANVEMSLKPAWGVLEILAEPGSRVVATRPKSDPIDLGEVPEDGRLRARKMLYSGTYTVEVSHPRFRSVTFEDVRLPRGRQVSRKAEMEPKPGKVRIVTEPEGAIVSMDGERMGSTPFSIDELPLKTNIVFKVTHPDYRDQERTVQFFAGDDDDLDFGALEHKQGTLIPEVTLDGNVITDEAAKNVTFKIGIQEFTDAGRPLKGVHAGAKKLEIMYPDYQVWSQKVRLGDNETVTVVADLIPSPGYVALKVESEVPYGVFSEGKMLKGVNGRYPVRANREQKVEVRARDRVTATRTVHLGPGEEIDWTVEMVTIPGPADGEDWMVPYTGIRLVWVHARGGAHG